MAVLPDLFHVTEPHREPTTKHAQQSDLQLVESWYPAAVPPSKMGPTFKSQRFFALSGGQPVCDASSTLTILEEKERIRQVEGVQQNGRWKTWGLQRLDASLGPNPHHQKKVTGGS